jgi:hypothetical protein
MDTYTFIVALVTGIPGLLAGVGAFVHSFQTKQALKAKGILE